MDDRDEREPGVMKGGLGGAREALSSGGKSNGWETSSVAWRRKTSGLACPRGLDICRGRQVRRGGGRRGAEDRDVDGR